MDNILLQNLIFSILFHQTYFQFWMKVIYLDEKEHILIKKLHIMWLKTYLGMKNLSITIHALAKK